VKSILIEEDMSQKKLLFLRSIKIWDLSHFPRWIDHSKPCLEKNIISTLVNTWHATLLKLATTAPKCVGATKSERGYA